MSEPEHNTGSDRYLITYADLITLLLGLFVILYSSSQVDKTKFAEFSEAFNKYFNPKTGKILNNGEGELQGSKGVLPEPVFSSKSNMSVNELYKNVESKLAEFLSKGMLTVKKNENSITLVLPEVLLFPSGKASVLPQSYQVLDSISNVLKGIPFEIAIDGHTDIVPIRTFQYESNWHLSVDRALQVGYYLLQKGIEAKNVVIRGFGPERPVDDNSTPEGRAKNRRVEITISQITSQIPATNSIDSTSSRIDSLSK